jgi:hypothetical protein
MVEVVLFVKAGRYVTDDDYRSFRDFAPELLKYAMDLSLHTGCGLAAILSLTWRDVHTVGVRRDRWEIVIAGLSGAKRKIAITQQIESALRKCRVMEPNWPHQYVIRFEADGERLSVKEFNLIWRLYMRRWAASPTNQFSFHDIRAKALTDRQLSRRVSRRPGH